MCFILFLCLNVGAGSIGFMYNFTWCLCLNFCSLVVANDLIPCSRAWMPTLPACALLFSSVKVKFHLCCLFSFEVGR